MCHCQEKVVHVLLLVVRFVVLDADDYFALVAFQMARSTLHVAWLGRFLCKQLRCSRENSYVS